MADWSQLPAELLDFISKRLDTSFDVIRFRSVCSTWRSGVTSPKRQRFAPRFPVLPGEGGFSNNSFGFSISKRAVFLLGLPKSGTQPDEDDPPSSWIIKIGLDAPNDRIRLLNPLTRSTWHSLPDYFPKALNLLDFRVSELGQEYVLRSLTPFLGDAGNLYMEKVAVSCLDNNVNDFVLLTIHVSGKLAMFKSSDKQWTIIESMPSPYDDVILYKGNFYAVDNTGRTVSVGLDFDTTVIGMPVFGGDKKFLVESKGELLLVDMYLTVEAEEDSCSWTGLGFVEYFENLAFYMNERTVKFKVYKLDEGGKEWLKVRDLDDRVVFLGDDCTFSASVDELSVSRGNCIIFSHNNYYSLGAEDGQPKNCDVGVFDLEDGSIGPLEKFPEFSKLFWPPPRWISSTTLDQQARINMGESS